MPLIHAQRECYSCGSRSLVSEGENWEQTIELLKCLACGHLHLITRTAIAIETEVVDDQR